MPKAEFKGLIKVKENLLLYANEKAKEGKKKTAENIRFAVGELSNPLIKEIAEVIVKDGVSQNELFALGLLGLLASTNE